MTLEPTPPRELEPRAIRASAELHERVLRFARLSYDSPAMREARREPFEELALAIARFQREHLPGLSRLSKRDATSLEEVPAVPAEAFRLTRVAVHPPELDVAVFETSGTTQAESGKHPVRDLRTYDELAILLARHTLFRGLPDRAVVVGLAAHPGEPPRSSLGYMMELFMKQWDGRKLTLDPTGSIFDSRERSRWLATSQDLDLEALVRAAKIARSRSEPLVVLATAFALAGLLEILDGDELPTPQKTVVMVTGGFKGRVAEIASVELRRRVAAAFRTDEASILGEYGMTELTSQLYEAVTPKGPRSGVYVPPPWLRVIPVAPEDLRPVARGEVGLARFVDLANVDSSLVVQTEDLVRETDEGFELLGRHAKARLRGCSLPYEGLIPRGKGR